MRRPTDEKVARVVVLVPAGVHKAWKREAVERGVTVSDLIRGAMAPISNAETAENHRKLRGEA